MLIKWAPDERCSPSGCALFRCGWLTSWVEFRWYIHPYSLGLPSWQWGNHRIVTMNWLLPLMPSHNKIKKDPANHVQMFWIALHMNINFVNCYNFFISPNDVSHKLYYIGNILETVSYKDVISITIWGFPLSQSGNLETALSPQWQFIY